MTERKRVAARWIVRIDGTKILPTRNAGPPATGIQSFAWSLGPGKCGAVGASHAQIVPFRVRAHRPVICEARLAGRRLHLTAPGLAAPVVSALDQEARRAGKRIVRLAERRGAAVAVIVDAHVEPHLRHPLRVTHRACPRADHLLGFGPAAVDDGECVEQFGFPIFSPARLAPGEGGERGNDRPHVFRIDHDIAERRLHAPEPEQNVAVDAVVLFDA